MNVNLVAIDPSLISTGMCVNGKFFNYCPVDAASGKGGLTKWFRLFSHVVKYRYIEYHDFQTYSQGEIVKLVDYNAVTDMIATDIMNSIDTALPTKVIIEGFSYSAKAGNLIDLVTFSTLLRIKILKNITKDILVVSPSTLKLETAKLCYAPLTEGKKQVYKNPHGVAGGKFTKRDMCFAIIDQPLFADVYAQTVRALKTDFLESKAIKKPVEDMNDAYLLYQLLTKLHVLGEVETEKAKKGKAK